MVNLAVMDGNSPLLIACQIYLFNNVYLCTNNGQSQLYAASFDGHHKTVDLLLKSMQFWYMYMYTTCLLCPELWKKNNLDIYYILLFIQNI